MPIEYVSVKEASEQYGYSGSHIRDLLSRGIIRGEKFTYIWMVDPKSVEAYKAQMDHLGKKKHGVWAGHNEGDDSTADDEHNSSA